MPFAPRRRPLHATFFRLLVSVSAAFTALPAQNASTRDMIDERRKDLELFRRDVFERDRSYSLPARAEAARRLEQLERDLERVTSLKFELELARITALADNGHTQAFVGPRSLRYNRVRIRLVPFGDQFHVLRADTSLADLLGARLVAIDGRPVRQVADSAHTLVGGTAAWRDRSAGYFMESPEQMFALGVTERSEGARYRFVTSGGATIERRLVAEGPSARRDRAGAGRWLHPDPFGADSAAWLTLLTRERAPWVFRDIGVAFRWRAAPEISAIVVQLRQNVDAPGRPIRGFLAEMLDTIRARQPQHVVLDLRGNGGGDLNNTRDFVQQLPTTIRGRVFVLTSPWTFSAAISTVGYLKQAAPDRVTIVGEHAGDRLEFWAEGRAVELPHSRAGFLPSTERHDYANGCRTYRDCHGSVVRFPISVKSFAPDIPAPLTFEAYRAGRDPGMEAIAAAVTTQPASSNTSSMVDPNRRAMRKARVRLGS